MMQDPGIPNAPFRTPSDTAAQEAPAFSAAYPNERSNYPRDAAAIGKWRILHSAAYRPYKRLCLGIFLLLSALEYLLYCFASPLNPLTALLLCIAAAAILFLALFTFVDPFCLWVLGLFLAHRAEKQLQKRTDPPKHAVRYDFYPDRLEVFHGNRPDDCTIFALRAAFEGRMRYCLMDGYLIMKGPAMIYNAYDGMFLNEDTFDGFIHLTDLTGEQRAQLLAYLDSAPEWRFVENLGNP